MNEKNLPSNSKNNIHSMTANLMWKRIGIVSLIGWLLFGSLLVLAVNSYAASSTANEIQADSQVQSNSSFQNSLLSGIDSDKELSTIQSYANSSIPTPSNLIANANQMGQTNQKSNASNDLATSNSTSSNKQKYAKAYEQMPLTFEANQGQTNAQVKFLARNGNFNFYLTDNGFVMDLAVITPTNSSTSNNANSKTKHCDKNYSCNSLNDGNHKKLGAVLKINLQGENSQVQPQGANVLSKNINYFVGKDSSNWKTDVTAYGSVNYSNIYTGITQTYYGNNQEGLEYNFTVNPSADPTQIALGVEGAESVEVNPKQELIIKAGNFTIREKAPEIYQVINGKKLDISGGFLMLGKNKFGFQVGNYDRSQPLTIDPTFDYSTLLGSDNQSLLDAIAADNSGNVYVAGSTTATTFPTTYGAYSSSAQFYGIGFVSEFSPDLETLIYSSILPTYIASMVVDNQNNIDIYGIPNDNTSTFPLVNNYPVACHKTDEPCTYVSISHIDRSKSGSASLTYSTLLGSTNIITVAENSLEAESLAVDSAGNIYFTGLLDPIDYNDNPSLSYGFDFPTTPNAYLQSSEITPAGAAQSFVAEINPNSSGTNALVYSTLLSVDPKTICSSCFFPDLFTYALTVDTSGKVYITGWVGGTQFSPISPNALSSNSDYFDSPWFMVEMDFTQSGSNCLVYSTKLGGNEGNYIKVDPEGFVYITGWGKVYGDAAPTYDTGGNISVIKLNLNLQGIAQLVYNAEIGGSINGNTVDSLQSMAIDNNGKVFISGGTNNPNYPTTSDAFQTTIAGNYSDFLTELDTTQTGSNTFVYSTFLGSSNNGTAIYNSAHNTGGTNLSNCLVVSDNNGNVFVAGDSAGPNAFPNSSNAYQNQFSGSEDLFVLKFTYTASTTTTPTPTSTPISTPSPTPTSSPTTTTNNTPSSTTATPTPTDIPPTPTPTPTTLSVTPQTLLGGCDSDLWATDFVTLWSNSEQLPCQKVNPNTGNYAVSVTDLAMSSPPEAPNMGLVWERFYNSFDSANSTNFGFDWRNSYEYDLTEDSSTGNVTIIMPSGRRDVFVPSGTNGGYLTPTLTDSILVKTGSGNFTLTTINEETYTFVSDKLTRISDPNGNTIVLTYGQTANSNGQLSGVGLCLGSNCASNPSPLVQTFTINYNTNNLISSVSDLQRSVSYNYYPANNYLKTIYDAIGSPTIYTYDANHQNHLQTVTDPRANVVVSLSYDNNGNLLTATDSDNNQVNFDYNTPATNETTYINAIGYQTIYSYDPTTYRTSQMQDALGSIEKYYYDTQGHLTKYFDKKNHETDYTYDNDDATNIPGMPNGSNTTVKTADGTVLAYNPSTTFNSLNQPLVIKDARQLATNVTYYPDNYNPQTVTDPNGNSTTYYYDSADNHPGRIDHTVSSNGLTTVYHYDASGFINEIEQEFTTLEGTSTTPQSAHIITVYYYDNLGRLRSKSGSYDPTDNQSGATPGMSYEYDNNDHVTLTTNQLNEKAVNVYDAAGNLTNITNFLGQATVNTYDARNLLYTSTQKLTTGDLTTTNNYDPDGNLVVVVDPKGVAHNYSYDVLDREYSSNVVLQNGGYAATLTAYDVNDNVVSVTHLNSTLSGGSGNQETDYGYDELNRVISTTTGVGVYNYQTLYKYDNDNNILHIWQSKNGKLDLTNLANPNLTTVVQQDTTYDNLNRPTTIKQDATNATVQNPSLTWFITTHQYDDNNNKETVTDPNNVQMVSQGDALGRLETTTIYPNDYNFSTHTSSNPVQTSYNLYDANSQVIHTVDAGGNWTDYGYDASFRPTSTTKYATKGDSGTALTSRIIYLDSPQPKIIHQGPAPYYEQNITQQDEAGRTLYNYSYTGESTAYPNIPAGQLTTVSIYDGQGNVTLQLDANNHPVSYNYENTGWLLKTDQINNVPATQLSGPTTQRITTSYGYDLVGNRIRVTDGNSHTSNYTFDVLNRPLTTKDGNGHTISVINSYDSLNHVTNTTDGNSQTSSLAYDNAGRLLKASSQPSASNTDPNIVPIVTSFNYGLNIPQATQMVDNVGSNPALTTSYNYDDYSRLSSVNNAQGQISYGYDSLNRRSNLCYGPTIDTNCDVTSDKNLEYGYDGLGRVKTLTTKNFVNTVAASTAQTTYNYVGDQLDHINYPDGSQDSFYFDGAYRLDSLEAKTSNGNTAYSATYRRTNLGSPFQISELAPSSGSNNFVTNNITNSYDNLNQLISSSSNTNGTTTTLTYNFDQSSNRKLLTNQTKTSSTSITYNYDNANRLISDYDVDNQQNTTIQNDTYSYDNDNNLTSLVSAFTNNTNTTTTYKYDARNRLISSLQTGTSNGNNQPDQTSIFSYDGTNTRLSAAYYVNNGTQLIGKWAYLQDVGASLPVVLQQNYSGEGGNEVDSFLYTPGSTTPFMDTSSSFTQGRGGLVEHTDDLGTVRVKTYYLPESNGGSNGTVSPGGLFDYTDPYGSVASTNQISPLNSFGFTGQQYDNTGLYYNRARYYSSGTGRFTQSDSYGGNAYDPTSLNRYSYGGNNPYLNTDPSGHCPWCAAALPFVEGGLIDYGIQVLFNSLEGKANPFTDNISLPEVGIAAATGGLADAYFGTARTFAGLYGLDSFLGTRATNAAIGAVGGVATGLYYQAALNGASGRDLTDNGNGQSLFDPGSIALNAVLGGAFGALDNSSGVDDVASELDSATSDESDQALSCSTSDSFNSFQASTPVETDAQGDTVPISSLKVGDHVLAYNPNDGSTGVFTVTAVLVHTDPTLVDLTISGDKLETTPQHPFYVDGKGWVNAGDLVVGDQIRRDDGSDGTVEAVKVVQRQQVMYNLTVDVAHTFFVGDKHWLVHNKNRLKCLGDEHTIKVKNLGNKVTKHGINEFQAEPLTHWSTDDLLSFDPRDPIRGEPFFNYTPEEIAGGPWQGIRVMGGHHRLNELFNRFMRGEISGDTEIPYIHEEWDQLFGITGGTLP